MVESEDNKESLVIDFSFVPSWARRPPTGAPEGGFREDAGSRAERRPREDRDRSRDRRPPLPRPRSASRDPRDRQNESRGGGTAAGREAERKTDEQLSALDISFLPERRGLAPLAHRLARSLRAYSLFEVATLFLSKPEFFAVRISVKDGMTPSFPLFQCAECKAVFLDRDKAASHVFAKHFERYCRKEEQEGEPPKGNFVCVARCGMSGTLLGPPNYHGYSDRLLEVHKTRFPNMPVDEFRAKVETVHDAALIEKWKEEMRRQVTYFFGKGEGAVTFTRFAEAEAWFREHCLAEAIHEGVNFVMPGSDVPGLEDSRLRGVVEEAIQRESRFPLRLSVAVRLAFRHLGLHTFKTGDGHTFLTAVEPSAIDLSSAVPLVREIIDYVAAHPGCTRLELQAGLRPVPEGGAAPDVTDIISQMRWLVEKGHVIEFSDGRLAAPRDTVLRVQPACPRHTPPPRDRKKEKNKTGAAPHGR